MAIAISTGVIMPNFPIMITTAVGIILSAYMLYVEYKLKYNEKYRATCDLDSRVSCTRAVSSPYGHILKLPNALIGLGFYVIVAGLAYFGFESIIFYLSIPAILMTLYLVYVSYFKMKSYCLVCHGTYLVNIAILVFSYLGM